MTLSATLAKRYVSGAVRPARAPADSRTQFIAGAMLLNLVLAYLWVLRGVGRFARPRTGPPPKL